MLEIPESANLSRRIGETLSGKTIQNVKAAFSPHKFAWYSGDPENYHSLLSGKKITGAAPAGGMTEIFAEDCRIVFSDGVSARYFAPGSSLPKKHQLLIGFEDFSAIVCTVQMYGGMLAFRDIEADNPYYLGSKAKPSPLCAQFDKSYFLSLYGDNCGKLSAKAYLATGQRIPGLGNGVLQDILFRAKIHPKRKMSALSGDELEALYRSVKDTLFDMAARGGRDTECDLFGTPGGYKTILSKNTALSPCPVCGGKIIKEAYLGGSVYFCPVCQRL
jgi:formamidopyrimidine-DNA glycosylase